MRALPAAVLGFVAGFAYALGSALYASKGGAQSKVVMPQAEDPFGVLPARDSDPGDEDDDTPTLAAMMRAYEAPLVAKFEEKQAEWSQHWTSALELANELHPPELVDRHAWRHRLGFPADADEAVLGFDGSADAKPVVVWRDPLTLSTPCTCAHPYNWHTVARGCDVGECACRGFVRPESA